MKVHSLDLLRRIITGSAIAFLVFLWRHGGSDRMIVVVILVALVMTVLTYVFERTQR